jgi:hypothetical protein
VLRWTSVALIGLAIYFLLKNKRIWTQYQVK